MLFYFTNSEGKPVAYKVQVPVDAWTQSKGGNTITVIRSSCWMRMGAIGGVVDVPQLTEIQVVPSSDNNNTIGVKYVVQRGDKHFVGFGSSNDFSVVKKVDVYKNKDGSDKQVVSGNALHALEMAVKRAKVVAIATALGFDHNEMGEILESHDYIINPSLRKIPAIGYKHNSLSDLSRIERAKVIPVEQMDIAPVSHEKPVMPTVPSTPSTVASRATQGVAPKPAPSNTESPKVDNTKKSEPSQPTPKPQASQSASAKPAPKPEASREQPKNEPGEFIITFGKHKGKALITILSEDSSYIKWLVENSTSPEVKANATALLNKLPNLATSTAPAETAPSSYKEMLKEFWKTRGYDPKAEVKDILEKALSKEDLSYNNVSEEEARTLYAQKEQLFPIKQGENSTGTEDELDRKTKSLLGQAKCCVCEIELKEPEIKVSLKKAGDLNGRMMCFRHVRLSQEPETNTEAKKCEKCNKVLDQQELQFIKEYDSAQLCTECQVG